MVTPHSYVKWSCTRVLTSAARSRPVAPDARNSSAAARSGVVGLREARRLAEAAIEADVVGALAAVDRHVALDERPGHELDVPVHLLERQVEHDVAEAVVRALALEVAARDAQLVGREVLVPVVVGRHDHQALAQIA